MQLSKDIWIEGSYYVEIDGLGQLCIVGPNNHLHFGSVGLYANQMNIHEVALRDARLTIKASIAGSKFTWFDPAIGHIRKVRSLIELPGQAKPTFAQVMQQNPDELIANKIREFQRKNGYEIVYRRQYVRNWYGVRVVFAPDVTVERNSDRKTLELSTSAKSIQFTITAETNNVKPSDLEHATSPQNWDTAIFGKNQAEVDRLLKRIDFEIEHLIMNRKTSGFDYGTVFPRDWMEAADLGGGNLPTKTISYMYHKAFEHIDPSGEGWHEDIIGEYRAEKDQEVGQLQASIEELIEQSTLVSSGLESAIEQVKRLLIVRNMIDIEPHYIMGLDRIDIEHLSKRDIVRLRRAAQFILHQAAAHSLITFKKLPQMAQRTVHPEYYGAGNWRDSQRAYRLIHPVIAPYDVNVVFYPQH